MPVAGFRNRYLDATFMHRQAGIGDATIVQYSISVIAQVRHHRVMQCAGVNLEQDAGAALSLDGFLGTGRNRHAHPVDLPHVVGR